MTKLEQLFHQLWGQCKDKQYDKQKWIECQRELEAMLYPAGRAA